MTWKDELKNNITTVEELEQYITFTPEEKEKLKEVADIHPMSVTRYYLSLWTRMIPRIPFV